MSENNSFNNSLEATASWNTRYLDLRGFVCQITLRADSGKELLDKADAAIIYLIESDCLPCESPILRTRFNNNPKNQPSNIQEEERASDSTLVPGNNGNGHICPIHQVEMRRWEKDGRVWFSHKAEDGGWCSGKRK